MIKCNTKMHKKNIRQTFNTAFAGLFSLSLSAIAFVASSSVPVAAQTQGAGNTAYHTSTSPTDLTSIAQAGGDVFGAAVGFKGIWSHNAEIGETALWAAHYIHPFHRSELAK